MDLLQEIAVGLIQPNPEQPRKTFDQVKLEQLAESIKANGLIHPITVEPSGDGFILIAGERRWRAHVLAGLDSIQAKVVQPGDAETRRRRAQAAFVENYQREQLNPVEEGHAIRQMRDELGMTLDEIGQALGMSKSTVSNKIRLVNDLPDAILDHVAAGKLSERQAAALLPFYSLPVSLQDAMSESFVVMLEEAYTTGKSSELIRKELDMLTRQYSMRLDNCSFFDMHLGDYEDEKVIRSHVCKNCEIKTDVCPDPGCFARKTELAYQVATQKMKTRHDLTMLPLGSKFYDYNNFYHFRNGDIRLVLENRCENMAGLFFEYDYSDHMRLYPGVRLVCTKKNCGCEKRILRLRDGEPTKQKQQADPVKPFWLEVRIGANSWTIAKKGRELELSNSDILELVDRYCDTHSLVLRAKPDDDPDPPTPPDEPVTKSLTDEVIEFCKTWQDNKGRTWKDITNPSHTNGIFWDAIKKDFDKHMILYKNDSDLKFAIKQAFAMMKRGES